MSADIKLEILKLAARFKVIESLLIEGRPIVDTAIEVANIDIVEVISRLDPFKLSIIYIELTVRRHLYWLDRRDISTDNLRGRELVGKVSSR